MDQRKKRRERLLQGADKKNEPSGDITNTLPDVASDMKKVLREGIHEKQENQRLDSSSPYDPEQNNNYGNDKQQVDYCS